MISKPSTSEKFIVCIGFKFSDISNPLKKMEKIKTIINKNNKMKICDLFNSYEINEKLKIRLIKINILTSNKLFQSIGEIVNFINSQDYYGDTYENYRNKQIEANDFWINTFYPDPKDFKETKKKITDSSFLTNKINVDDTIQLEKKITQENLKRSNKYNLSELPGKNPLKIPIAFLTKEMYKKVFSNRKKNHGQENLSSANNNTNRNNREIGWLWQCFN